jgi:hypothetical protein
MPLEESQVRRRQAMSLWHRVPLLVQKGQELEAIEKAGRKVSRTHICKILALTLVPITPSGLIQKG